VPCAAVRGNGDSCGGLSPRALPVHGTQRADK
jgi:hypothetical protein